MKFMTGHSFLPYSLSFIKDMTLARLCPALGKGYDSNEQENQLFGGF